MTHLNYISISAPIIAPIIEFATNSKPALWITNFLIHLVSTVRDGVSEERTKIEAPRYLFADGADELP